MSINLLTVLWPRMFLSMYVNLYVQKKTNNVKTNTDFQGKGVVFIGHTSALAMF